MLKFQSNISEDIKKALIVVDYQKDFVDGTLGFSKAGKLHDVICDKIKDYRSKGFDIMFTMDTHSENYLNTLEGRFLPVKHCIDGTSGHSFFGDVGSYCVEENMCFRKGGFASLELFAYLKEKDYKYIELVGLVTDICVLSSAVMARAYLPDSRVVVDASGVASFDDILHEKALDVLESIFVEIVNR